jgi:hypothetical protein
LKGALPGALPILPSKAAVLRSAALALTLVSLGGRPLKNAVDKILRVPAVPSPTSPTHPYVWVPAEWTQPCLRAPEAVERVRPPEGRVGHDTRPRVSDRDHRPMPARPQVFAQVAREADATTRDQVHHSPNTYR